MATQATTPELHPDEVEDQSAQQQAPVAGVNPEGVAYVAPEDPDTIHVQDADRFDQQSLNHEALHGYLDHFPNEKFADVPRDANKVVTPEAYKWGDYDSLIKDQAAGKTIHDYNPEQLAKILETYTTEGQDFMDRASRNELLPEDVEQYHHMQQAVRPMVQQLAALSGKYKASAAGGEDPLTMREIPEMGDRSVDLRNSFANPNYKPDPTPAYTGAITHPGESVAANTTGYETKRGYSIDKLPAFIRQGEDTSRIKVLLPAVHTSGEGKLIGRADAEHYMDMAQNSPSVARAMATHDAHRVPQGKKP